MSSPSEREQEPIAGLCRLVFLFRLFSMAIAIAFVPQGGAGLLPLLVALVAGGVASYAPVRWWSRFAPTLMRHPLYLGADLLLGAALLALAGVDSPFVYFTLSTALLAGVLYRRRGAAVFSLLLPATYLVVLFINPPEGISFATLLGTPALYPLAAAGGAGVRELLDRQADTERALIQASQAAAVEGERSRIARDMHDSLAKTLHGMSLSASALGSWVERDPDRARADAGTLAEAARDAAAETRTIIGDLRRDALDLPLGVSIASFAAEWAERTGVAAGVDGDGADAASATVRWELFSVLREALANVEEHARAGRVEIRLRDYGDALVLEVADDGIGFHPPDDPAEGAGGGHYGLLGMAERARRMDGELRVTSTPDRGTKVQARIPAAAGPDGVLPSGGPSKRVTHGRSRSAP